MSVAAYVMVGGYEDGVEGDVGDIRLTSAHF